MKIGVMMPAFGAYAAGAEAAEAQRVLAQRAENLGFDSLWVADHVVWPVQIESRYPYTDSGEVPLPPDCPMFDALTYLSYIAAVTTRVRLGTAVMVLPHRNPILCAKMLATLDVLSGGRVVLGAGVGYLAEEIRTLGVAFESRGALSDEYVAAMRALWTQSDPSFAGEFVRFDNIKCEPKPIQQPLPIWFGGHSRRMMRRVVSSGEGCIFAAHDIERFRGYLGLLEQEAAAARRDIATIERVAFLTTAFSVDLALQQIEAYARLGIDHFIAPLAAWGTTLSDYFTALTRFAEQLGLRGRADHDSPFVAIRRSRGHADNG